MHVLIVPSEHFVTARYPVGGIFQLHQALALHHAGYRVGVMAPGVVSPRFLLNGYPYLEREQVQGFPVFRRYQRQLMPQRFAHGARAIALHGRIGVGLYQEYVGAHGRPDVIHAHNLLFAGLTAQAIHRLDGTPYIVTEHSSVYGTGPRREADRQAVASCAADAVAMTAVSSSLANDVRRALQRPDVNVGVLPNTLDPLWMAGADGGRHEPAGDDFAFLNVASLDVNKDQRSLIKAFAASCRNLPATLRIGGVGDGRADLEALARELDVERQVTFLGYLTRSQVREEMQRAGCFVLSSRYETFGVVLLEALACGTPVVATRCGGPDDIVNDTNGILVNPGDVGALGAAMARVYRSRGEYRPDAIRRDCLDRFGADAFVAAAGRLYTRAAQGVA